MDMPPEKKKKTKQAEPLHDFVFQARMARLRSDVNFQRLRPDEIAQAVSVISRAGTTDGEVTKVIHILKKIFLASTQAQERDAMTEAVTHVKTGTDGRYEKVIQCGGLHIWHRHHPSRSPGHPRPRQHRHKSFPKESPFEQSHLYPSKFLPPSARDKKRPENGEERSDRSREESLNN